MIRVLGLMVLIVMLKANVSHALCVIADKANLRAEPSSKGRLVWTVGKYMPFLQIGRKGSWFKVKDMDGQVMWVFNKLVSTRIDCAVIKVRQSLLRNGAGKRYPTTPLTKAFKYTPFKKLDRDDAWLKLQDDYDGKHWVHESDVWEPLEYSRLNY